MKLRRLCLFLGRWFSVLSHLVGFCFLLSLFYVIVCFFSVAYWRKYGVSVFFVVMTQLALTSSGSLPVHFRVLLLLRWCYLFLFSLVRPSFFFFSFSFFFSHPACLFCSLPGLGFGVGLVTESRLTLCLFVLLLLCYVLFRWVRGAGVSGCLENGWVTSLHGVDCVHQLPSGCCHCVVWVMFTFLPLRVVCCFVHCDGPSPCVLFVGGGGGGWFSLSFPSFLFIFRLIFLRCFSSVGRLLLVGLGTVVGYCCLCNSLLLWGLSWCPTWWGFGSWANRFGDVWVVRCRWISPLLCCFFHRPFCSASFFHGQLIRHELYPSEG